MGETGRAEITALLKESNLKISESSGEKPIYNKLEDSLKYKRNNKGKDVIIQLIRDDKKRTDYYTLDFGCSDCLRFDYFGTVVDGNVICDDDIEYILYTDDGWDISNYYKIATQNYRRMAKELQKLYDNRVKNDDLSVLEQDGYYFMGDAFVDYFY